MAFMRAERELAGAPGQLGGAEDLRLLRHARVLAVARAREAARRAADAPGIEEAAAVAVVAVQVEGEHAGALDEERPPLGEERLEAAQVHDRRIGLDLAEVGIHRRGQRDARAAARI